MNDRFQILFDHSSDAHFILDENGITDCNDATIRLLKCKSKSDVLALHPSRLSPLYQPDGQLSSEKAKEMDALAVKNGYHRFEWMHQKVDGEVFPVEVTLNSVEIDGRRHLIAVWHDLTQAKTIQKQLVDLNQRMSMEIEAAAEFQRSLLPQEKIASQRFESHWFYKPCDELGGDSLNIFWIDDNRVGMYVLDVTGHGVASSLLSVTATHFLSERLKSCCPHDVVKGLNAHFSKEQYKNHVFTLVYGVLDLEKLSFSYTSAGHLGPVHLTRDGQTRQWEGHGIPIGMFEDADYRTDEIPLKPGDRLFLLSDGVFEARNAAGEDLGVEGIHRHLKKEMLNKYSLEYSVSSLARATYHWAFLISPATISLY